jgi:hypothetical protein
MKATEQLDRELNQLILSGKAMEGFERFYHDNVRMQENTDPPTVGKDANRKREEEFFSSVEEFHEAELRSTAVDGQTSLSEWLLDVTLKDAGRVRLEQVAVRQWQDGKVVDERFYYNKN